MNPGELAVLKVYNLADILTIQGHSPKLALLPDMAIGRYGSNPNSSKGSGERVDMNLPENFIEGHACIGAFTLAAAFAESRGEPETTLISHGSPDLIQFIYRKFNEISEQLKLTLRCEFHIYKEERGNEREVHVVADTKRGTKRRISPPPRQLEFKDLEYMHPVVLERIYKSNGIGFCDLDDAKLSLELLEMNRIDKKTVILIDTIQFSGNKKRHNDCMLALKKICELIPKNGVQNTYISVSGSDLKNIANNFLPKKEMKEYRNCEKEKKSDWNTIREFVKSLSKQFGCMIVFHDAHLAAIVFPDDRKIIQVSTFNITPTWSNGAGDAFNSAFLAAQTAKQIGYDDKNLELSLTEEDCLIFASAVSGARLHNKRYVSRWEIEKFTADEQLRDDPPIEAEPFRYIASHKKCMKSNNCEQMIESAKHNADALLSVYKNMEDICDISHNILISRLNARKFDNCRRILFIDLDHTMFDSQLAREVAGFNALREIDVCKQLSSDECHRLFRFIYEHSNEIKQLLDIEKDFRLTWNTKEFYQIAITMLKALDWSIRNMYNTKKQEKESWDKLRDEYLGNTFDNLSEATRSFDETIYNTYSGVQGGLSLLNSLGISVYCLVEGDPKYQQHKMDILRLTDLIPNSRFMSHKQMLVSAQGNTDKAFQLAEQNNPTKQLAINTVKDLYTQFSQETQSLFRTLGLAAVCKDHSGPSHFFSLTELKPGTEVKSYRPVKVAIISDKPKPDLTWFDDAALNGEIVAYNDEKPEAIKIRVLTPYYSSIRIPKGKSIKEMKSTPEAIAYLCKSDVWKDAAPVYSVKVPRVKLKLENEQERACMEVARISDQTVAAIANQLLLSYK